jgi:O-antigen ligase
MIEAHDMLTGWWATLAALGFCALCFTPRAVSSYHGFRQAGILTMLVGWAGLLIMLAADSLRDSTLPIIVAGAAAAGFVSYGVARLLTNSPTLVVAVLAAAIPIRIPLKLSDDTVNVLAPLYAALIVFAFWQLQRPRTEDPAPDAGMPATLVTDVGLALFLGWGALTLPSSFDIHEGAVTLGLFLVPFALLYALLRQALQHHSTAIVRGAAIGFGTTLAASMVFGLAQEASRTLWQNPKVIVANAFTTYFRTNSIFWDPNIYGRYLACAVLLLLTGLLFAGLRRHAAAGLGIVGAVAIGALWFTYSQSSFAALAAGCFVLLLALWGRAGAIALGCVCIAAAVLAVVLPRPGEIVGEHSRSTLVRGGLSLAAEHPVSGMGIGSFEKAFATVEVAKGGRQPKLRASHTSAVTIAAELGIVGLAALALAILGAIFSAVAVLRREHRLATLWGAATCAALVVHSMVYGSLFEDPLLWAALAFLAPVTVYASSDVLSASATDAAAPSTAPVNAPPAT